MLFDGGYLSAKALIKAFNDAGIYLKTCEMENLMGLPPGTLAVGPKIVSIKPLIVPK